MKNLLAIGLTVVAWLLAVQIVQRLSLMWFNWTVVGREGAAFWWRLFVLVIPHGLAFFSTAFVSLAIAVASPDSRRTLLVLCLLNFIFMIQVLFTSPKSWEIWFTMGAHLAGTVTCAGLLQVVSPSREQTE